MTGSRPLGPLVHSFFLDHLITVKGLRPASVRSYRDTIRLLLCFVAQNKGTKITKLSIEDLTFERILAFLRHLEHDRANHVRTRNHALPPCTPCSTNIATREPEMLGICQQVAATPTKRAAEGFQFAVRSPRGAVGLGLPCPDHEMRCHGGPRIGLEATANADDDVAHDEWAGLRYRQPRVVVWVLGGALVLVDQTAEDIDAPHRAFHSGRRFDERQPTGRARRVGRLQVQAPVRPRRVVVAQVLGQHAVQLWLVPDQRPVQTLRPYGAYPPFSVGVGRRSQLHRMRTIGTNVFG
jgi:hypothetical protein